MTEQVFLVKYGEQIKAEAEAKVIEEMMVEDEMAAEANS